MTIQHPAHVHFFRPVVEELRAADHEVSVFAREKEVATRLLDAYGLDHRVLAGPADSLVGLATTQARYEYRLLRAARRAEPDVVAGVGGTAAAHVAALTGARGVVFTDSEVLANAVTVPFADVVCTPRAFGEEYGAKQVRYDGYQELAYLHPARFEPDPAALRAHGVEPDDPYAVLRFTGLDAHHDVGQRGLSTAAKRDLAGTLADRGAVYVSAEGTLPDAAIPDVAGVRTGLPVPPHLVHHLLASADVLVTDSSTMATEAAVLGTPAVRSNSFAGDGDMGNFLELEGEYGLVRSTPDEREAVAIASELAADPSAGETWRRRRNRLLEDAVDVAAFAADVLAAAADPARRAADVGLEVSARA